MKNLFFIMLLMATSVMVQAQIGAYNAFNEFQSERLVDYTHDLDIQTITQRNKIEGTTVVEIYEQGTGKFLGYWGDPSKFDLKDLPYLKSNKKVKKLIKTHSIPVAIAIYQETVITGMTEEEVVKSWAEANKVEEIEGVTIMRYDDATIELEKNAVTGIKYFAEIE